MPGNVSDIVTTLNNFDDVQSTYHFTSGTTITSSKSDNEKTVQLIGLKNTNNYLGHKFVFEAGDYDPEGVVLTVPIAERLNVWVGDSVELEILNLTEIISFSPLKIRFELINVSYEISGIVDEFNGLVAYVDLVKLKTVSNFPDDPANSVLLQVEDPTYERLEEIRSYIYDELEYNVRIISTKEETIGDFLGLLNIMYYLMYALAAFSVLLAVAMVYNTVYINLEERKREMATLLTIGTSSRSIVKNVTLENFVVTVIGTILGIILGYLLLVFFLEIILDIEFFRIKTFISVTTMVISFVLTLIGVLVAQYFPLRRILNLNLAEATKERIV
jgi:putative ABC transport system permease protein